jgi:putative copper resistance protein D
MRSLHFASLMTIFGAGAYATLLRRAGLGVILSQQALRAMLTGAATLALASASIWLALVAGQMSGDWHAALDLPSILDVLRGTRFGHIFLVRIAGLSILCAVCLRRDASVGIAPFVLAGALLGAIALTSHAAASGKDTLSLLVGSANDTLHLLAAGFWTGGLALLALLVWTHRSELVKLLLPLRVFSQWGTYAVATLVLSGFANIVFIRPAAPWRGVYGEVLAIKMTVALGMIVFACLNRWSVTPALATGAPATMWPLGRNVAVELVLGLAIVAIVGQLGLLPPR